MDDKDLVAAVVKREALHDKTNDHFFKSNIYPETVGQSRSRGWRRR